MADESGVLDGDGGDDTVRVPNVVAEGWETIQSKYPGTLPSDARAGEGTTLRAVVDELSKVGGDGEPLGTGTDPWEFGVPQEFDGRFTPDTDVEWPVTISQTYALQIEDPKYLEDIDAFATAAGDCDVRTKISNLRTVNGAIVFTMEIVLDCPSPDPVDFGGGFIPNPSDDSPPDAPKGPPIPGPSDPSGGGGGGGGDVGSGPFPDDPWDDPFPYTRAVSPNSSCVPEGGSGSLPVRIVMESGAVDAYDLHFSYDPAVIEVTGAAAGRMAPTIQTLDNENGYLHITSDAGTSISFDPYKTYGDEDLTLNASFIEYDVVGANGDETAMELTPRSEVYNNGSEPSHMSYGAGTVTVGAGFNLPSKAVPFGGTVNYTVSTKTGVNVGSADVGLSFPAGPVTIDAVKSTDDMNVTSWDIPEAGVLEVQTDAPLPTASPDLFTIEFEAYEPTTPGEVRNGYEPDVTIDGTLSSLYEDNGDEITTPCSYNGSVRVLGNVDPERPDDGDGGRFDIPEAGVVYWPIILPLSMNATGLNTAIIEEEMVQVGFTSDTNDVNWEVDNIVVAPENDPTGIRVDVIVEIPKADPQTYPVDLNGRLWLALDSGGFGGDGLLVGVPVQAGGGMSGVSLSISFPQIGPSGQGGVDL